MKKWAAMAGLVFCLILNAFAFASTTTIESETVSAEQALNLLKEGNHRFSQSQAIHPNQTAERRMETLEKGQHPFVTLISCSDSRVPLETLFDQGIGDLFVIRVAGNIAGDSEVGSAEYGVEHLHTPLLVVLGHTKCGAVTAAATHAEASGKIEELVGKIAPVISELETKKPELKGDGLVTAAVEANVRNTIKTLLEESDVIKKEMEENKIKVVGAIYDLSTGTVKWLD